MPSDLREQVRQDRERERAMRERYEAQYRGWRRSTSVHVCPQLVAGKRCVAWHRHGVQCVCQRFDRLLDHARLWIPPVGGYVLTAEPYHASGENLAAFVGECSRLGLRVSLSGRSPYFPGSTLLIEVRRAEPRTAA